jgi:iron-sulfur cluster repair protein YtfE (RIC family)
MNASDTIPEGHAMSTTADIDLGARSFAGSRARTVTEYLMTDHRRLDEMLAEAGSLFAEGDHEGAGRRFAEFSGGLDRHIGMEEEILFPEFERATGSASDGPTEVMRQEHVGIRCFVAAAAEAIRSRDAAGFSRAVAGLKQTLGQHNVKEEGILYPMTDSAAGDDRAREELVRRLQAF